MFHRTAAVDAGFDLLGVELRGPSPPATAAMDRPEPAVVRFADPAVVVPDFAVVDPVGLVDSVARVEPTA